jgi:hypothetical protein
VGDVGAITVLNGSFGSDISKVSEAIRNVRVSNSTGSQTIVDGINANTRLILNNSDLISQNSADILNNTVRVQSLEEQVNDFSSALASQFEIIQNQIAGTAAVVALPDLYLNSDEAAALSGGIGIYGGEVGFGSTFAIRGDNHWNFGASVGFSGDQYTGKLQARYAFKKKQ